MARRSRLETATEGSARMADFFISLSGKDKVWGDWIAWQLKDAGFEVIYQHLAFPDWPEFPAAHGRRGPQGGADAGRPFK
jgi:TIR domain